MEPIECVLRWQTANVLAQWTLRENNTLTDLQMSPSFCSAYFPRCMLSVPLRIILSFFSIHILIVLHLHYSNLLRKFSSVTHLSSNLHNHASLFFVSLLCRVLAKFQKMIISLVMSVRLSAANNLLPTGRLLFYLIFQDFFLKTYQENSGVII